MIAVYQLKQTKPDRCQGCNSVANKGNPLEWYAKRGLTPVAA
jgi:hypothetical protein